MNSITNICSRRIGYKIFSPSTALLINKNNMSTTNKQLIPLDILRKLPKVELHTHLDGAVRPETLLELVEQDNVVLPGCSKGKLPKLEEIREILRPTTGVASLVEFLRAYEYLLAVLQNTHAIKRVTREMAEDYGKEGVTYLEIRFCPALHEMKGSTAEEILSTVCEETRSICEESRNGNKNLPIVKVIVCGVRSLPIETNKRMAELAVKFSKEEASKYDEKDCQIVGFDLAGDEAGFETKLFKDCFDYVKNNSNLGITIHSGEASGWESVKQALDIGYATRIGHGVRLIENKELLESIGKNVDNPISIEICIVSNVLTKAIDSIKEHPVRTFLSAGEGIRVVPCTDGPVSLIGKSISEHYDILQKDFGLNTKEILKLLNNGFKSTFAPDSVINPLFEHAQSQYEILLKPYETN